MSLLIGFMQINYHVPLCLFGGLDWCFGDLNPLVGKELVALQLRTLVRRTARALLGGFRSG